MDSRRKFFGLLGGSFAATFVRGARHGRDAMITASAAQLTLEISPRGDWRHELFPEQSAEFDLVLRNAGTAPVDAFPLYGSHETPRILLFDASGNNLGIYTKADQYRRKVGDLARIDPPQPKLETMEPGEDSSISFNIWGYRPPLPPGRYSVVIEHQTGAGEPFIRSNQYAFEIVRGSVKSAALGYDSPGRGASVLAWFDAGLQTQTFTERLLVRVSATKGHTSPMQGATSHGEFPADSHVSVAQVSQGSQVSSQGWLAVIHGHQITAIRHNLSYPVWKSEPLTLPVDDAVPVPRFPDMYQRALILATGNGARGAALAGVLFEQSRGPLQQWTIPLKEKPSLSACVADVKHPVALLLVTNHGNGSRISRLDLSVDGKVSGGEKVIRDSQNRVVAVTQAWNPEAGTAFLVLESSPLQADRLALVAVPLNGEPLHVPDLAPMPGWPRDQEGKSVEPLQTQIEQAKDGSVQVAFVDSRGFFYTGALTPQPYLRKVRADPQSASIFPHIAALSRRVTAGCFTGDGLLFTAAGGAGE